MQKSAAVVAMGGYNTFCEILSLDKRVLIVPRTRRDWSSTFARSKPSAWGWPAC
jgi:predicted glycosyltransferase